MLWIRYSTRDGASAFGCLEDGAVAEHRGEMFGANEPTGRKLALSEVRLAAPCMPSKIVALWNNFHALAEKLGKPVPAHPLYLLKPATCVNGPEQDIVRPPRYQGKITYEGELGIVIGCTCRNVDADEAAGCIFGYTCVNDVTSAQLLDEDPNFAQWTRAKASDTFGCLGPAIATSIDFTRARVVTTLDGAERQNFPLADMVFPPQEIVSRLSADLTLLPGDVIACGTSIGVGSMKDGALVSVHIDGIGELRNRMRG